MPSVREQYWRYSLVALIVGLGTVVFVELTPFLGGLMGAATIYVLLRGQMCRLTGRHGWRRSAAAWLLLGEAVCCFLVPISLLVWMVAERVQRLTLDPRQLVASARHLAALVQERTGYDLWQESNLRSLLSELPHLGQWLLGGVTGFAVNVVVLLFVLYFMLLGGRRMEEYIRELLPFSRGVGSDALHEVRMIVRSNAIGVPLLAVVQGGVALAGYLLFGVPDPLFWGVLTCLATIIPVVGTALVWVPLALWLGLGGLWRGGGHAVGQCRAARPAAPHGRHPPAHHGLRRGHRPLALRVHGGDLRAAAVVDVRLLRACLQAALSRPSSRRRRAIGPFRAFRSLRADRRPPALNGLAVRFRMLSLLRFAVSTEISLR